MIIYQDDEILILNKPSGIAVQGEVRKLRKVSILYCDRHLNR